MIVADASLIANLLVPGLNQTSARSVFDRDNDWNVPPLWQSEMRNILLKYVRANLLDLREAIELFDEASRIVTEWETLEMRKLAPQILLLAKAHNLTAYDAEYVALAQFLQVPVLTFDQKLARSASSFVHLPEDFLKSRS